MGKGGDNQPKSGHEAKEVLIDGQYYDVSKMKHPGGNVILTYANNDRDATIAFNEFHHRSRKAKKILDSLSSRPADEKRLKKNSIKGQREMLADFRELERQLEAEGFFEPAPLIAFLRIAEVLLIHVLGIWLLFNGQLIAGAIALGFGQGRNAMLTHEISHNTLTCNLYWERLLEYVSTAMGIGMSQSWWRNHHNRHHSAPQRLDQDVDLKTLPLVAFTEKIVTKRLGVSMKWWIRLQAIMFPLVTTTLVGLSWQFIIQPRHSIRTKKYGELAFMTLKYALWTYFVTFQYGLAVAAGLFLVHSWVSWNFLFLHFALNHTHLGTVAAGDDSVDWVRYGVRYTMNIAPGPFGVVSWIMMYLNFQVEHHLFPAIPQFRLPYCSHRVKALCEKHGLPYQCRSYFEAFYDAFSNLHKVGEDVFHG